MKLKWYPGSAKSYDTIKWALYDDDENACPFKAIIHNSPMHSDIPHFAVWNEATKDWIDMKLPEGLSDEEVKALLTVEYRTQ